MESSIWSSRKFWIMSVDTIVALVLLIGGWYLDPAMLDRVVAVIAILQIPVGFVIGSIALQNVAGIKASGAVQEAAAYNSSERVLPKLATASGEPVGPVTDAEQPIVTPWRDPVEPGKPVQ